MLQPLLLTGLVSWAPPSLPPPSPGAQSSICQMWIWGWADPQTWPWGPQCHSISLVVSLSLSWRPWHLPAHPLVVVSEVLWVSFCPLFCLSVMSPWVSPLILFLFLHFSLPHPLDLGAFAPKTPLYPLSPTQGEAERRQRLGQPYIRAGWRRCWAAGRCRPAPLGC